MTEAKYESEFQHTKHTRYLALTVELWGVFCQNFRKKWPRYNGTVLYFVSCDSRGEGGCGCNIGYHTETHLKLKSREISVAHNLFLSSQVDLEFCAEYGGDTVVSYGNCQNDWASEIDVLNKRYFTRFELRMSFGRIFCIAAILRMCYYPQSLVGQFVLSIL